MRKERFSHIEKSIRERKISWKKRAVSVLMAAVITVGTGFSDALPIGSVEAATICGIEEHTHVDACYTEQKNAICGMEEFAAHTHTAECYTENKNLVCGQEEAEGHSHGDGCYEKQLVCQTAECDGHTHSDACNTTNTFIGCGKEESAEHTHNDSCNVTQVKKTCGKEESAGHKHGDGCYQKVLVCQKVEAAGHTHGDSCYQTNQQLTCNKEETAGHTHGESCYQVTRILACTQAEHTHGTACYPEETEAATEKVTEAQTEKVTEAGTEKETEIVIEMETENESEAESEGETESELESESETELTEEQKLSAKTTGANVTADCEEGVLPAETVLQVVEILQDSEEMGKIQALISGTLTEQKKFAAAVYAFDIEFVNEANEAVVPEGQVEVEVMFNTPAVPADAANTWTLFHITDEGIAEDLTAAETTVISADETGAVTGFKFSSSTFSPYVLVETAEGLSAEQLQANYESYLEEVKKYEESGVDEKNWQEADELLAQIMEAYENGELTEENYKELYERLHGELVKYYNTAAESAEGTAWMTLRDSGWFQEYSAYAGMSSTDTEVSGEVSTSVSAGRSAMRFMRAATPPSGVQVVDGVDGGGSASSTDSKVNISKTIAGTDLENVFDITLKVDTTENIKEMYEDPDMAVVIVMDISNTMRNTFGNTTRYKAAMTAAEQFLDKFAASSNGISKVGYVAFNTDAYQIFGLQSCSNATEAATLKDTMRTETGNIIDASDYAASHSRFTNIEAGLQCGWDMLKKATNKNKYIIFLSDGFPTTYISSGYKGYDPYDYDGDVFYDHVLEVACKYGTSYSDTAAICARKKATAIKNAGITIFSVGVDVGGQTIKYYHDASVKKAASTDKHSIVERKSTKYEIGDASSTDAYKNWLGNSIGSGYYYDSTNSSGLSSAYDQIFAQIKTIIQQKADAQWVATDPMPVGSDSTRMVEFIGFYTKTPELTGSNLSGAYGSGNENTAVFDSTEQEINWDLKKSGYQTSTVNGNTVYSYQLVYRVRLKNESDTFAEGTVYDTNNPTKLTYQKKTVTNGNTVISDPESLDFPIPSVKGYLVELEFTKLDSYKRPVVGAQFTLKHDTANCCICRGNGTSTPVADMTAASGTDGIVKFTGIPSGHIYKLEETHMPNGYYSVGNNYQVTAAYDEVTVTATDKDGNDIGWKEIVINNTQYRLPNTGGPGTTLYTMGGLMTVLAAGCLLLYNNKKRGKEAGASS